MKNKFSQIKYEQRCQIKLLLDAGVSKNAIAKKMGIHHSTVYREIERGTENGEYDPNYVEERYQRHLQEKGPKYICDDVELAKYIADMILINKYSPEKIVEILNYENRFSKKILSPTTIYNSIKNGKIPGVSMESLHRDSTILSAHGTVCIPEWIREKLELHKGDVLLVDVDEKKGIIFMKK